MQELNNDQTGVRAEASRMADFIMFTQRSFLLNLSKELNKGNVSFAQFFLLGYLASEDYLTMSDIARKMGHSTAAATGLVDRLEKLGMVKRVVGSGSAGRSTRNTWLHWLQRTFTPASGILAGSTGNEAAQDGQEIVMTIV